MLDSHKKPARETGRVKSLRNSSLIKQRFGLNQPNLPEVEAIKKAAYVRMYPIVK